MECIIEILVAIITGLVGVSIGYVVRKKTAEAKIISAEAAAEKILEDAKRTGETIHKEAVVEAKEDIHKLRHELDKETRERRSELQRLERRLQQKEENLDRKIDSLEKKEDILSRKEAEVDRTQHKINDLYNKQLVELERISGLTSEDAKNMLLTNTKEEVKQYNVILSGENFELSGESIVAENTSYSATIYPVIGYEIIDIWEVE